MAAIEIITESETETRAVGEKIGGILKTGDFVCLSGELGAGKTTLVKGIVKGLGVPVGVMVSSPSFAIVNEYPGRGFTIFHMDAYRLGDEDDMLGAGYEDYISRGGVIIVEWPERIAGLIPKNALWIKMWRSSANEEKENMRTIDIETRKSEDADSRG